MSSNGNQVPLVPNQRGSGAYPRASTPHRPVECYLPGGTAGAAYIPNTTGGAQPPTQATHRAQTTPQPSAPPASQQDISKTNLAGHSYVSPNQTPQPRQHFQYRPTQHGTRPNSHPRQQQSFIPSVTATTTGPVVYPTIIYQHTPMSMQTYQQQRSSTSGYYPPYMGPYIGYNTPPSHTPPPYYYPSNNPQLPTPSIQANNPSTRNNPTTLVGPQGTPATATPPTATLTHAPSHMHSPIPGIRPLVPKRQSHRLPIIDPVTQQDIFSEFYSNDHRLPIIDPVTHQDIFCTNDNFLCGETNNDRQTPQLEHNVNQEFTRMVNEAANLPSCDSALKSNYVTKNVEPLMSSTTNSVQIQTNAIMSVNNNIVKSDLLAISETKNLGPDVAVVASETPIVSAISDSPVIVPKLPLSNKQLQKNSDQNVVLDTNKNISHNKQCKENVPQEEGVDKSIDSIVMALSVATTTSITNVPAVTATLTPSPLPALTATTHVTQMPIPTPVPLPQPQRIREPRERTNKLEDKEKSKYRELQEKESLSAAGKCNGSTTVVISSVDSLSEVINRPTSPINQTTELEPVKKQDLTKEAPLAPEPEVPTTVETNIESEPVEPFPTATQLLSASIEKAATDQQFVSPKAIEINEASSGIEAQAKLTQSISSVLRSNQPESKMKDINLNNKTTDSDAANGNPNEVTKMETVVKEDINKNDKVVKSPKNTNKKSNKMTSNEINVNETESPENGKNETDKVVTNLEKDESQPDVTIQDKSIEESIKTEQKLSTPTFVPKYRYTEEQWSPLNKSGKKCYDIGLLKQIKDDPLSKNKPNAPLLEACNVIRTSPMQEPLPFTPISRPMNDSLFPPFAKSGMGSRNNNPREVKKDVRNMTQSVKGSVKLNQIPNAANQPRHIYVSLSLREEVKLNEVDSAWKPTRFRKENLDEEELKTQELYKKFRGILNKLTPQKFDTLLDKVKTLEINNQKRLEGVIDLVFEKAIDEPNFSEAYATMCNKLSMLKVPADNATPEHFVNFRALIINKCQKQFETAQVDEQVLKLEKELADCSDPTKKKELQLMLDEENRRLRMRSVGNVRFIGELYKLKMLTSKIMDYCMKNLIDKIEEEKLECLCKLLTTIGEQVENESSGQLDSIFKKMQDIVDRKSNKISSRVRFMLQDVIELRKRKWVAKTVIDSQPKMMDQIQKEAEQQQRHIELINAVPIGGGFRRDEGGKGKRGDSRRQNSNNSIMDNTSKSTKTTNFPFDTSKFKAVSGTQKNLNNIKLAPPNSAWTHGSGTKTIAQASSNSMFSLTKNTYSILDTVQTDPSSLRANRDITPTYHSKGASIERSTFMTRGDISGGGVNRPGSVGVTRSNSSTRSNIVTTSLPTLTSDTSAPISSPLPQEPLPDSKKKLVKSMVDLRFINPDDNEFVAEVNQYYLPQHHAALVAEILNLTFEKSLKEYEMIAKSLLHLVSTGTISPENFVTGLKEMITVAPEHYIDVPMLYDNLGKLIALQLEKKHITFVQIFNLCDTIIAKNHGPLILKAIFKKLKESMGPSFVKSKWQESGLELKQWMDENQVTKWLEENKLEFLEGDTKVSEETNKIMTPPETQSKLIQLMNAGESYDCIKGWLQDNFGKSTNEDWFMRTLIQAICKYALHGAEGRDVPHFNQERMNKYARLINEFGESIESREANCLFGVQQLIRTLEHPKGLTLEIFQYLHEQYLITCNGFIAWEGSEKEPEGKGVMMMALTSFFTNIKEADNEDSCSED